MTLVKITVVEKALHAELSARLRKADLKACDTLALGQTFITGLNMPDGFCSWAWQDISRMVLALQTGGTFNRGLFSGWMREDGTAVACCTDGFRPVSFLLERVESAALIKAAAVSGAAPAEVYESERWGEFTYTLPGLAPHKKYTVRLHFCETWFSGPGKRRFSVESNGVRVIDDLDLFAAAGGFVPLIREHEVSADAKGAITLSFLKGGADHPKINAIEVLQGGKCVMAINAGGPACGPFSADAHYDGGNVTA